MKTLTMITMSFALLGSLQARAIGQEAFGNAYPASTEYRCQMPRTASGEMRMGGPGYGIKIEGQTVSLEVFGGADEGGPITETTVLMTKTQQYVEGAAYEAEGVTATIMTMPFAGALHTTVSISNGSGEYLATASCN